MFHSSLPSPDHPSQDIIEAFTALHQDDLDLPSFLPNVVGHPVLRIAKPEVMGAQTLEWSVE